MAIPQSNWSEADMNTWARNELMRGKTKSEVAVDIMRAGWSKSHADALTAVVVQDLNREAKTKIGQHPFLPNWLLDFGERVGCFFGDHRGQWEYASTIDCRQSLAVCRRCGREGASRTHHAWGEWYDRGWFRADERRCSRCGKTERQQTQRYGGPY